MTPSGLNPYLMAESNGRRFPLGEGQSWAIGRGDGCAVLLDSRSVSRLHALIQRKDGGDLALVDLGSRNGSFVNGTRVSFPVVLNDKDRLMFGDQELVFRNPAHSESILSAAAVDNRNEPTTALHTHSLATIMVVDIRDFTPLARTLTESLLSQTIGTWFLRSGQIVQRMGSWAQKYIGDAVMAVWVHDKPKEVSNDLLRTLRAISEINAATEEISRTLPLPAPLRIGAGVNTGPAIIGGTDYTALGDTVNAAFRLESATKSLGMGVAIGEKTYEQISGPDMSGFTRKQVELKGYEGPSTAWAISFQGLQEFLKKSGS
ncbi:MAG TPA: adenylate/guanylate cyclase domain-containing protein [Candidatus Solibacter sp.]|nr:adenylate/guanylate cyclase domain-containing protein [Candidatus Solibacter sp.]